MLTPSPKHSDLYRFPPLLTELKPKLKPIVLYESAWNCAAAASPKWWWKGAQPGGPTRILSNCFMAQNDLKPPQLHMFLNVSSLFNANKKVTTSSVSDQFSLPNSDFLYTLYIFLSCHFVDLKMHHARIEYWHVTDLNFRKSTSFGHQKTPPRVSWLTLPCVYPRKLYHALLNYINKKHIHIIDYLNVFTYTRTYMYTYTYFVKFSKEMMQNTCIKHIYYCNSNVAHKNLSNLSERTSLPIRIATVYCVCWLQTCQSCGQKDLPTSFHT